MFSTISVKPAIMHENRLTRLLKEAIFFTEYGINLFTNTRKRTTESFFKPLNLIKWRAAMQDSECHSKLSVHIRAAGHALLKFPKSPALSVAENQDVDFIMSMSLS